MNLEYHVPVLANEVLEYLNIKKDGTYLDCTLGGGGHTSLILKELDGSGKMVSLDRDPDAIKCNQELLAKNSNFTIRMIPFSEVLSLKEIEFGMKFDAILLDLGISSYQINEASRGFSYLKDSSLDMRMGQNGKTAKDIINNYNPEELVRIFFQYGEEKNSKKIVREIVKQREIKEISTTIDLADIIRSLVPYKFVIKTLSRIFQALRIEVNNELEELKNFLSVSMEILNKNGRVCVISYHSLEDRIVKEFINKQCSCFCDTRTRKHARSID